jgi:hypothetical protein
MQGRIIAGLLGQLWSGARAVRGKSLRIFMHSCKNADMRTSLDFPDALFKHLKTRAAQEGRTLRDLVIELVERGLTAREVVDPQKRFDARPVFGSTDPAARPVHFMSNAALYEIMYEDDDERAIQFMARR